MSTRAVNWAWRQRAGGAPEKCVLVTLAVLAGDDDSCFVSRKTLAENAEMSRSAVERMLRTLIARGLIFRETEAENIRILLLTDNGTPQ